MCVIVYGIPNTLYTDERENSQRQTNDDNGTRDQCRRECMYYCN